MMRKGKKTLFGLAVWSVVLCLDPAQPCGAARGNGPDIPRVSPVEKKEERLPGSSETIEEAAVRASVIVVAEVIEARAGKPNFPGIVSYQTKVKVVKSLEGNVGGELSMSVTVVTAPNERAEAVPVKGQEYLFLVERPNAEQLWTLKVLPATPKHLRSVSGILKKKGVLHE